MGPKGWREEESRNHSGPTDSRVEIEAGRHGDQRLSLSDGKDTPISFGTLSASLRS